MLNRLLPAAIILPALLAPAALAGTQAEGYFRITEGSKEVGVRGFSLLETKSGYQFQYGESFHGTEEESSSYERLNVQLDKEFHILSLRFDAEQEGRTIKAHSAEMDGELVIKRREGNLPEEILEISPDTAFKELGILRFLMPEKWSELDAAAYEIAEPMTLGTGSSSLTFSPMTNRQYGKVISRNLLRPGGSSTATYMVKRTHQGKLEVRGIQGIAGIKFVPTERDTYLKEFLAVAGEAEKEQSEESNAPTAKVTSILETVGEADPHEFSAHADQLTTLGSSLLVASKAYRGESLSARQKIIFVTALGRLGTLAARTEFLGWFPFLSSYEKIMTVRTIGDAAGAERTELLLDLLVLRDRETMQESLKELQDLPREDEPGVAQVVSRIEAFDLREAGEHKTVASLLYYATREKLELPASTWLHALKNTRDAEPMAIYNLLGRARISGEEPDRDDLLAQVRQTFGYERNLKIAGAAGKALGRLGDIESIPSLINVLTHDDLSLVALGSLHRITGLKFPADAERWQQWWEKEQVRYEEELPEILENLEYGEKEARLAALARIPEFTLGRDEIRDVLQVVAEDEEEAIRAKANLLLAKLDR